MKKIYFVITLICLALMGFSQQTQILNQGLVDEGIPVLNAIQPITGQVQADGNLQPGVITPWVLPSTNSTSGNSRIPRNAGVYFQRCEYLITAAEMAASGFPSGNTVDAIGFLIATAGVGTQTGTLNIYLRNTTDATYTLGSTWTTSGFTQVCNNTSFTVPIAAGSYSIPFTGGAPFTYTGGAVYVAWEFSNPGMTGGTTTLVAYCNTAQASMCYGYQSATAMGTAMTLTAYRPATYFQNNTLVDIAQITNIYTTERVPVPFGSPNAVGVRVANVSASAISCNVTLTVKDVATSTTRYTATLPVTALAAGTATVLNFSGWAPTIQENINISATTSVLAGETFTTNNTLTLSGNVNNNLFSYNYSTAGAGGYGFTYPGTGIFAAKYHMNGTGLVTGANILLYPYASNPGNVIYAVVMNSAGTIIQQSANYTIISGDLGTNKYFAFPANATFTNEDFYVGIAQTAGTAQYYPLGLITESPARGNTFYTTAITGGAYSVDAVAAKYAIEAVLVPPPTAVTSAATSITCSSATLNGTMNANGNSTTVTFEYGLTASYGSTVTGVPGTVTGTSSTSVTANITGLTNNTLYHYRIKGVNLGGTTYGDDITFTTQALPTVTTTAATSVTTTAATMNGTINANGMSTTVSFEYGLNTSYGSSVAGTPSPVTGTSPTAVSASLTGLTPGLTYHCRVNGTNSCATVNGNDMTFVTTACPLPDPAGTITGPAAVCLSTSGVVYSVPSILNATGYVWSVPTGVTIVSGSNTNSITVDYGASAVSGNVSVYGTNTCGNGSAASKAVTVYPVPVPVITGTNSVCAGTTGVVYSTAAGQSNYLWTVSAGGMITAGTGTNTITVTWNTAGAQTVSVNYTNAGNCSAASPTVYPVTVNPRPVATLTGITAACLGHTDTYTTESGMSSYIWTVSAGGTVTSGAGTNAIMVQWNTLGPKTISVNYTNSFGCPSLTAAVLNITVSPSPLPTITGSDEECAGVQGVIYSTEAGFSGYTWSVSNGGIITGGNNTNTVTVNWNAPGNKFIAVDYYNSNGCNAITPTMKYVTVHSLPAPLIFGDEELCSGTHNVVYTTQANYDNYVWEVSSGGTIVSGQGSKEIIVNWNGSGNQTVSVNYTNADGCEAAAPYVLNVSVVPKPAAAGVINGPAHVCVPENGVEYSIAAIDYADSYEWTVPAGVTVVSGTGTNSITVDFSAYASSGIFKVFASNECGNGASSPNLNVTVASIPPTPTITYNSGTLTSSAATGNQWYKDGVAIAGATEQTYVTTEIGTYTVMVTLDGCSSEESEAFIITSNGTLSELNSLVIQPSPNNGKFKLIADIGKQQVCTLEIFSNTGALIYKEEGLVVGSKLSKEIDISGTPAGIYMLILRNPENSIVRKIVITQ